MLSLQTFAVGLLSVALLTGGAYLQGRKDGRASEIAERQTIDEVARVSRESAQTAAAEAIAKITVTHTTIRQRAETITREVPVYRDCVNDPRVVGLLDTARANELPAQPAGDRSVPTAGPGESPDLR